MKDFSSQAPVFNDHATVTDSILNVSQVSCRNFHILERS